MDLGFGMGEAFGHDDPNNGSLEDLCRSHLVSLDRSPISCGNDDGWVALYLINLMHLKFYFHSIILSLRIKWGFSLWPSFDVITFLGCLVIWLL